MSASKVTELAQLWNAEITRVQKDQEQLDSATQEMLTRFDVNAARYLARKASIKFIRYPNHVRPIGSCRCRSLSLSLYLSLSLSLSLYLSLN